MTGRKPVRVRRARYPGLCPYCGGQISVGQQVAAYSLSRWAHIRCHLKARGLVRDDDDVTGTVGEPASSRPPRG